MILFLIDILIFNSTSYNVYLILLNFYKKDNTLLILTLGLFLDFIIFKTYYKFSIVLFIILLINKKILNFNLNKTINFICVYIINYVLFIFLNSVINNNFSYFSISQIIIHNLILNITISMVYYYKFIKT